MALLASAPVWAAPRIAIIPFGRYPVERQLTQTLCREVTCVPSSTVMRQGRLDWEAVSLAQLTGVVTGKIVKDSSGRKRYVDIQVLAPGKVMLVRKKATLQNMALSSSTLKTVTADLVGVLNRAHGPERTPPPKEPVADGTVTPPVVAAAPPSAPAPAPTAPTPGAPAPAAATAAATPPPVEEIPEPEVARGQEVREPALLEVEATFALLNRQYSYSQNTTANPVLRNSTIPLAGQPGLLVGIYPLRSDKGFFESVGLQLGTAIGVGMELQRQNDTSGTTFPVNALAANVSLLARFRLGKTVRLAPVVGWQGQNFDVQKASNGTPITGQPGVHWRAVTAGLKLDVDFSSWCTLFAEFNYLFVTSAGPLANAPYFTSISAAPSFQGAAGLSFRVAPRFEIRVSFIFALYALNFGGPNVTGVTDELPGVALGFRYSL